ncbi:uncharacterized protein [Salminus brasiliensis]|uniref:uncharacterized protein n=1 Tax=Salminus brasiliensis TaxID=930266 RepID=UPI003B8372D2
MSSMMEPLSSSSGGSAPEVKRAASPAPSAVSMKSDRSMEQPPVFISGGGSSESRTETQRAVSPEPSCVSMKSDQSMDPPLTLSSEGVTSDPNIQEKKTSISREKLDHIFKELQQKFLSLVKNELNTFKKLLSADYPACSERELEDDQRQGVLKTTLQILRNMKQTDLANTLESKLAPACHRKLKSKLRDKCQRINEGISGHGNSALLNEIYTELYITEGGGGEVNQEHEVKQIEAASRKRATQETPIKRRDIFKPLPEQNQPIRTILTKGVAGIGKTVSVQKFILDWAEGEVNQDVLFIFPLPFRELNLMKEKKLSLVNLLQSFFPETQDLKPRHYKSYKIMFIFDGLDECRLPLDFQNNENLVDIEEKTSVDVLLTNLIKGNLLPSALLWITSRPAAVSQIPPECVDQVTEVRGFSDPQKQEYFRKRISDQDLVNKVVTHIRSSRSLYIMCHIPVFCWIAATVLERMLSEAESGETPKTLTQMFTHFLIFQIKHKSQKYSGGSDLDPQQTRESILSLGKLAFQQLEKGNLIFYEEDLRESGIDIREVSVYSGVCTQIFREEHELHLGKVFSFVHLSVQEFLAALYAFLCFINRKVLNQQITEQQMTEQQTTEQQTTEQQTTEQQTTKQQTSEQKNTEQQTTEQQTTKQQTIEQQSTEQQTSEQQSTEQQTSEQQTSEQQSSEQQITEQQTSEQQTSEQQTSEQQSTEQQSTEQQTSEQQSTEQQTSEQQTSEQQSSEQQTSEQKNTEQQSSKLSKLFSRTTITKFFNSAVDEALQSGTGHLDLFLRFLLGLSLESNQTLLRGVLTPTDRSSHSNEKTVEYIKKKIGENISPEKSINLFHCLNELNDHSLVREVQKYLNRGSDSSLRQAWLSPAEWSALVFMLLNSEEELEEFDLSKYEPSEECLLRLLPVVKASRRAVLASCNLGINVTETLGSVLKLENSSLKELDLSNNDLQDSGVELLSAGLKSSHCKLQILRLAFCNIGVNTCETLGSVLKLENSSLKELDLSNNDLQDSGVELLSAGLESSHCRLQILRLSGCMVTEKGCSSLAAALSSNPSHLKELDLTYNHPGESGEKLLSVRQEDPHCKLEILRLKHGGKIRIKSGLKKYACDLTLDPTTAHTRVSLSEGNRRVVCGEVLWDPDHPEWFDGCEQVMSTERLTGRCYCYKSTCRKREGSDHRFGDNEDSWSLYCSDDGYFVHHDSDYTNLHPPPSDCRRVGVYVDCPAGTLSFYSVSTDTHTLTHLHTFNTMFTQPLYAGIRLDFGSSVCLCEIK